MIDQHSTFSVFSIYVHFTKCLQQPASAKVTSTLMIFSKLDHCSTTMLGWPWPNFRHFSFEISCLEIEILTRNIDTKIGKVVKFGENPLRTFFVPTPDMIEHAKSCFKWYFESENSLFDMEKLGMAILMISFES